MAITNACAGCGHVSLPSWVPVGQGGRGEGAGACLHPGLSPATALPSATALGKCQDWPERTTSPQHLRAQSRAGVRRNHGLGPSRAAIPCPSEPLRPAACPSTDFSDLNFMFARETTRAPARASALNHLLALPEESLWGQGQDAPWLLSTWLSGWACIPTWILTPWVPLVVSLSIYTLPCCRKDLGHSSTW